MKKAFTLLLSTSLIMGAISPSIASAQSTNTNTKTVQEENSTDTLKKDNTIVQQIGDSIVTIEEVGSIRYVTTQTGETIDKATYNMETGELYLNGQLISEEVNEVLNEFEKVTDFFDSNNEISPFTNDPGDTGNYKLLQDVNFSINVAAMADYTVALIITVLTAKLKSTTPESIKAIAAQGIFSQTYLKKLPTYYFTMQLYSQSILYGNWFFYIKIYGNSARTQHIHTVYDTNLQ
ncbi:MAG: hypothetical protein ABS938_10170 [Psychrobacillus psychrodurans]